MSEYIARSVELEDTPEKDLADDMIFEPSIRYPGNRVAIAIKGGEQVCWCCFSPLRIGAQTIDAPMGEGGALVRICTNERCGGKVSAANRDRDERKRAGSIIQLGDLTEDDRVELVHEIKEKKKLYRGH